MKNKKVKCTDCGQEVLLDDMIISKDDWEGCTCYGHVITKKHLKKLRNEK